MMHNEAGVDEYNVCAGRDARDMLTPGMCYFQAKDLQYPKGSNFHDAAESSKSPKLSFFCLQSRARCLHASPWYVHLCHSVLRESVSTYPGTEHMVMMHERFLVD
jgi:hypothetical protein